MCGDFNDHYSQVHRNMEEIGLKAQFGERAITHVDDRRKNGGVRNNRIDNFFLGEGTTGSDRSLKPIGFSDHKMLILNVNP